MVRCLPPRVLSPYLLRHLRHVINEFSGFFRQSRITAPYDKTRSLFSRGAELRSSLCITRSFLTVAPCNQAVPREVISDFDQCRPQADRRKTIQCASCATKLPHHPGYSADRCDSSPGGRLNSGRCSTINQVRPRVSDRPDGSCCRRSAAPQRDRAPDAMVRRDRRSRPAVRRAAPARSQATCRSRHRP